MSIFNVCLVGAGNISKLHLSAICHCEKTKLVAVCDIDKEKADNVAREYNCKAFYDFDEMLNWGQFDSVHICTPHYLHAEMAIKSMKKGKNVFTEKPMAMKYEDAVLMNKTADENCVYLGVCFQNRYNDISIKIKEMLENHELGEIKAEKAIVTWNRDMNYYNADNWHGTLAYEGGGVLINQSIHTIDLLQWFADKEVIDIKADISQKRHKGLIEVEDTADAVITFENGVKSLFYASICYSENSPVYVEIVCENGKIIFNDDLFIFRNNKEVEHIVSEKISGPKSYWGNGHFKIINDFYNCVDSKSPFMLSGKNGIKAVKMVCDMYKASGRE